MRSRIAFPFTAAIGASFALASGCTWTSFDDLKDDLWVDVSTGPSSPGTTYGVALAVPGTNVAATTTTPAGGRLAVLGRNRPTLTRVVYDAVGARSEEPARDLAETFSVAQLSIHPAFAADPDSSFVGYVALTNSFDTQMVLYDLDNLAATHNVLIDNPDEPTATAKMEAEGLAFAALADRPDKPASVDVVFSRRDDVILSVDPLDSDRAEERVHGCVHGGDWSYAIAVGDVLSTHPGPEIIVSTGTPQRNGSSSSVLLVSPSAVSGDIGSDTPCSSVALPSIAKDGIADFGEQLLVVDLDGDGKDEILASIPSQNKVVLIRESVPGTLSEVELNGPGNGFGASMAYGDVDGDGEAELVVGAPKANPESVRNAGAVYVYDYDADTGEFDVEPIGALHDANPDTEQAFGSRVAVVPWHSKIEGVADSNVIVVAAKDEVFTYFRTALHDDVRAGP